VQEALDGKVVEWMEPVADEQYQALALDEPELIERCRERKSSGVVPLDPGIQAAGVRNSGWNLRVNARIDRVGS